MGIKEPLPDSPPWAVASLQVIHKRPVLLTVNAFGFLDQPTHCLSTGSGFFADSIHWERNCQSLPAPKCLQSCLCELFIVSVFWSHLYLDKEAAERLSKTVDEACLLLAEYNGRLAAELEDRRQLARMLVEYTQNQKDVLSEKEKKLEEYKQKLARVTQVRKELKSHIQSLPDLSLLPNVTGGLAPLPSAGDLFSTD